MTGWKSPAEIWTKLKPAAREFRHEQTEAEAAMWNVVRGDGILGFRFRRQHAVGQFIVDFYCPRLKLAIEVDGGSHFGREEEDSARQAFLELSGITVLRIPNEDVFSRLPTVVERIERQIRMAAHLTPDPSP